VCAFAAPAATEFKDVGLRCAASPKDTRLATFSASVVLDDAGRAFTVRTEKPERRTITVPYEDILKVIVESASATATPGTVAPEAHYWFYFERKPGAYPERFILDLGHEGAELLNKTRGLFGGRLQTLDFPMAEELLNLNSLSDLSTNYSLRVRRPSPPLPSVPNDRALIVAICPSVEGSKKDPINLDANGRVVAVNEPGTYSFEYLDPGEYTMISQAENARRLHVKIEAGKVYYFFQDPLDAGERTGLTMHSKEIAQFEIAGSAYSDWRRGKY
jgi:hypothetical protein